jgi:hypothetical protein
LDFARGYLRALADAVEPFGDAENRFGVKRLPRRVPFLDWCEISEFGPHPDDTDPPDPNPHLVPLEDDADWRLEVLSAVRGYRRSWRRGAGQADDREKENANWRAVALIWRLLGPDEVTAAYRVVGDGFGFFHGHTTFVLETLTERLLVFFAETWG